MDNEDLDQYFDDLIEDGFARRVPLADGRIDHRLTPAGEKELERRIRGVYTETDDE